MDPTAGIAWEATDRPFFDRLWSTVRDASIDPIATFRATGVPGSTSAAVRFSLITSVIGHWPLLFCLPCLMLGFAGAATAILGDPRLPDGVRGLGAGAICGLGATLPILIVLFSLYVELCYGVVFHVVAMIAGGQGTFGESIRSMMYTGAIRFWLFIFWVPIPFIGPLVHLGGRLVMLMWSGFACYGAALGVHRLEGDRAILVGIVTPCVVAVLTAGGFFAAVFGFVVLLGGSMATIGGFLPH